MWRLKHSLRILNHALDCINRVGLDQFVVSFVSADELLFGLALVVGEGAQRLAGGT